MLAGFLMTATSLMRPWQTGQQSASTPNARARSSAQVRYRLLRFFLSTTSAAEACSARGTIRDLHSLAAPSTPAYLTVWWRALRHARGETTQEGKRIHVDRDGPVSVGPLQEDADQAVFTLLELVLREGRPEHVSEQRLAA